MRRPSSKTAIREATPRHAGEIMADDQEPEPALFSKTLQKRKDARRCARIQRSGDLIGQEPARRDSKRPGEGRALALAARERMRAALLRNGRGARPLPRVQLPADGPRLA